MVPTQITGLVAQALGRFTGAFKNQPNCQRILASLLGQVGGFDGKPITDVGWAQRLENTFWQIITNRILANSPTGDQLDEIGGLLNEPRQGRSDAIYLPALIVRIRINRSQGTSEDIIQVSNLLAPGSLYEDYPDMKFSVASWGLADPLGYATLIGETKAIGSRATVYYSNWSNVTGFAPYFRNLEFVSRHQSPPTNLFTAFTSRRSILANAGLPVASVIVSPS